MSTGFARVHRWCIYLVNDAILDRNPGSLFLASVPLSFFCINNTRTVTIEPFKIKRIKTFKFKGPIYHTIESVCADVYTYLGRYIM